MEGNGGEAPPPQAGGAGIARRVDAEKQPPRDLTHLRWLLRIAGVVCSGGGAAAVIAGDIALSRPVFYVLTGAVFLALFVLTTILANLSRTAHVDVERRYRARLFIRNLELQDMAMRDDLTQLFNRRYFFERLRREVDRARSLQSPLSILILDVDHLKSVNDTYGHKAGDVALANLAKLVIKCVRTSDIPARLGGDEYGVIMPETDKDGAFSVAKRLQRALEVTPMYEENGASLLLSVCLGVSGFPWGGDSVDEVVQWADTHMYAAKTSKKRDADHVPSASGERSHKKG
jgi:diguanylate cyclase (GGDEF)-like protein